MAYYLSKQEKETHLSSSFSSAVVMKFLHDILRHMSAMLPLSIERDALSNDSEPKTIDYTPT